MKNSINIIVLGSWLILSPLRGHSQTAREISRKATDAIEMKSMEMVSTLKIVDSKGSERVRQTVTATREFNGVVKTMLRFTSPADVQGTAILIYDHEDKADDMWIYLPALRKDRRIVSSEKGKSFMGSEFTNADMSKPNIDDFEYKILGTESFNGKDCWKIEAVCKDAVIEDANGFSKKISWIEKNTFLVQKMEFYDIDGELEKVQILSDYRKQPDGKYFAYHMEKKNIQTGRKSMIIIDKFQGNSTMPESSFSVAVLSKS